ncbi:MAG TPA: squalene/phytoene synthase family protein [Candidatus Sulfomarinibacteraceae bacterium]|nr:squalene/phytoene synthase family protein [Candidatus Sulfomarinibacteraceae bacterium]
MMRSQVNAWELPLLVQAKEALNSTTLSVQPSYADQQLLTRAYELSEQITATHSRSFHLASGLLPPAKRAAARALYAFCRVSDNVVDESGENAAVNFSQWRARALAAHPPADDLVLLAWADARARFHIPWRYSEQLLDGVARDLVQNRYQTFEELAAYAYGVASTVGLMSMHITGFHGPEAIPYAVKLGVALQLTNILRDVGEDYGRGRVYLPQAELDAFGLSEADLAAGRVTERWRRFMRFQLERNRQLYAEAWPGIGLLDGDGRLAIAAATGLYRAILDRIEVNDYDVFNHRAHLGALAKVRRLPALWWRSRGFQFRKTGVQ